MEGDVLGYVVRRAPLANAEDVLAETFLVVWRRSDQVPDDELPLLLGVARRMLPTSVAGISAAKPSATARRAR